MTLEADRRLHGLYRRALRTLASPIQWALRERVACALGAPWRDLPPEPFGAQAEPLGVQPGTT